MYQLLGLFMWNIFVKDIALRQWAEAIQIKNSEILHTDVVFYTEQHLHEAQSAIS